MKSCGTGLLLDPAGFDMPAAVRRVGTGDGRVDDLSSEHVAAAPDRDVGPVPARSGQPAG